MVELEQWVRAPEPDKDVLPNDALPLPEVRLPQPTPAEPIFTETAGVHFSALLEQRASMPVRGRGKARVVPDEQGLLFSGVE